MAASKAAPSTTPSLVNVTSSTTITNLNNINNNNDSLVFTKPDICHNFHELCRSCGKTNDQLYDLFQTPNSSSSSTSSSSPFNTSSTTCYTHLNNSCSKSSSLTTSALATANKTLTTVAAVGNCAKTSNALTLDTVAATAKASAKGQSNMDNILQEMQIWQLMIKCNDGLPQRICAKCTAQFYMIHKFRRKCLKVQTQLRALNEEQKIYERRQQLENEKNGNEIETETEIKTETEAKVKAVVVVKQSEPTLQAEAVKPCEDLVNDKTTSEQAQAALVETKSSSSTSSEPSVSFETIVGNTNNAEKVEENDATLLDNVVAKTMPENSTMSAALAVNDKTFETHDAHAHAENLEEVTLKRLKLKDEKKPLLKAAVLNSKRSLTPPPSSSLTLKQSLEQICDNELTAEENNLENANKKLCLDQEDLLATHVIYKTNLSQKMKIEQEEKEKEEQQRGQQETRLSKEPKEAFKNSSTENLFITKAALKSYTIPPTTIATTTESLPKFVQNSEAKSNNDNNNNNSNAHLCDNPNEVNDNTCTSTSSPTTPSSSTSSSSTACSHRKSSSKSLTTKPFRTKVLRHKIVKYVTISNSGRSQKRSGYFTKTKKALANQSEIVVVKRKEISWRNKHKLKRLNAMRTCKSPTMSPKEEHKQEHDKIQQIENETSSNVSTITSTTSFSSSSSSSSSSSATMSSDASTTTTTTTTPDVSNLVEEQDNIQTSSSSSSSSSYNNQNTNETVSPSMEGISSNKSSVCLMWKTKAAMKANANDMPEDVVVHAQQQQNIAESPATTTPLTGSACLAKETRTSSKTLNENQSIISSSSNNNNNYYHHSNNNNNNNNLMEEHSLTNKVLTSTDNQVKDIEDESKPNLYNNLWPEEVDQKQIKANIDNEIANINDNYSPNSLNSEQMEMEIEEKSPEPAENLTPPNKQKGGCMKLIIQRKRGARFKCRRKEEDDDNETPQMSDNNNLEHTTPKRRRKNSANSNLKIKLDMATEYSLKREENHNANHNKEEDKDIRVEVNSDNERRKVPAFNSDEDENKENPIDQTNHPDFDSDSNVSVYRDPLLIRNEILEEETPLMDFPKPQLSLQTECSKEMYKLYKEKANLESPKKLIVRVPLTSLTQDFKRMHLTMEQETEEEEAEAETETNQEDEQKQETEEQLREQEGEDIQTVSVTNSSENEEVNHHNTPVSPNISSSQSDLLGFSQTTAEASSSSLGTADSSQPSVEMVRYVLPPLCSASSKINDFINDFQNNCIDSSEIDETCDMVPHLGPQINQELSDEIRDVEDTLNGILSEMHDKDMYTPRSGETDEFFAHSVYSPLTDSPTTPSQSFYAESPCTINSNPMSVSPFVHQNMDYNAMTPQSNHSSMGHSSHIGSVCSGGSSSSHAGVYSEHYPAYNECFEETTQSELIGFQNDIPCFENIDINNHANNNNEFAANTGELNEEEEVQQLPMEANCNNLQNNDNENVQTKTAEEIVDYIDLSDYKEGSEADQINSQQQVSNTEVLPQQVTYQAANNYQPSLQMPSTTNNLTTQPHYIVTNTNQGPIIIANPHLNQANEQMEATFKPHSNNLQFVTLGQAMEASNQTPNHLAEISWPATNNYNPQPVLTANNNGTTTYFINANGELYQASIPTTTLPNPSLNTILMPTATNTNSPFNQTNMDNNENYVQQTQPPPAPQPQPQPQQNGQYIMLVNNLGGTPQYYATTQAANLNQSPAPTTSAVLFQPSKNPTSYLPNNNTPKPNQNTKATIKEPNSTRSTLVPITPNVETPSIDQSSSSQTVHQRVNQQLQRQIKQRQLQLLQPRSPNVTQKITLVCRFCHKRPKFTNNVDYSNHIINTHPAEKPYNCPHCPKHFSRRFERQQHVAQVHGSRYQCAQCGLSFCAQRALDFHLQKYHANLGRSHQQQQQQHLQQNSTSSTTTTTSAAAPPTPATYQLLQHNQQQRLVRVEDVHVQVTEENKNKHSIDLNLERDADIQTSQSLNEVDLLSATSSGHQKPQSRKLGCPDCNGDNDDCCGSNKNHDHQHNMQQQEINLQQHQQQQQYAGNESVNNHQQHPQHITIPSPEQTEPDSTTTLRHFRKRQLSELTPHFATSPSSSSSSSSSTSSSSSLNNNNHNAATTNNNDNLNHNSPDYVLAGDIAAGAGVVATARGGGGGGGVEQIMVERSLRATHNCLLCEDTFTNEIALRKHHHLAHGAATQTITNTPTIISALVCTICKRTFRMRNALHRHMETHDVEGRPYECNICHVRFPRPSQLTLHKLTVHKFEKPNSCEECGKQFGTESAMKAHAKEHEEAASLLTASSASDTTAATLLSSSVAASSSTTSSSPPPPHQQQLPSRIYYEAMTTTTKTTSISTSTLSSSSSSSSTIITNEQNINLQSTTSGEECTTATNIQNNNNNVAIYNIATQNTIVSGLSL